MTTQRSMLRATSLLMMSLSPLVLTACAHGLQPRNFPPAVSPVGVTVTFRLRSEDDRRTGELLAAEDAGLIVRAGRIVRVRWEQLAMLDARQLDGNYDLWSGDVFTPEKKRRLALVSRFPQGLRGDLLAAVLRAAGQDAMDEVATSGAAAHDATVGGTAAPRSLEDFTAEAAGAAERFSDRRAAQAAGYRRIGADFPAMGEHWLLVPPLLAGRLDAHEPTMLTYAVIDGQPVLVGTGFVMTTRGSEEPRGVPGWPEQWHEHSGLIGEESGARPVGEDEHAAHGDATGAGHTAGGAAASPPSRTTRTWVMHIWTALENPAGVYRADNWALPFARAGVRSVEPVDERSGRALSLAVGGDAFLRSLLTEAGVRTELNAARVDAAIDAARVRAEGVMREMRGAGEAGAAHLMSLRATWGELEAALVVAAGPVVSRYLASGH